MYPTTYCPRPMPRASGASLAMATAPALPDRITNDNCLVLFVDCQVGPLWDLEFGSMRRRLADLAGTARRAGVPMVATAIDPENRGPTIPELASAHPGARLITRSTANVWDDETVRAAVHEADRGTIVIVGAGAELGVALCAVDAAADGFDVYVIFEGPSAPGQSGRWFGDRLVVTTCGLVAIAIETRTSPMPRDAAFPKSMTQTSRTSGERRAFR